jgi:HEAT repeat protein
MMTRHSLSFVAALAVALPVSAQVSSTQPAAPLPGRGAELPGVGATVPARPFPAIDMPTMPTPMLGPGPLDTGPMRLSFELARAANEQDREAERRDREREMKDRELQRAQAERDREQSTYDQGIDAMFENRWDRALANFSRLADNKGARADAALYWKAYAQNRLGQRAESLASIGELTKGYPNSTYLKQARALEVEVRSASGQPMRPEAQADEEIKLIAVNALANSNPQEAVPMLEGVLNGTQSPRMKRQALFVLAQINNARAREVLKNVAKGSAIPELQGRAIQYLGAHGGAESRAALSEIYGATNEVDVKRRILRAFAAAGERDRLLNAAQSETVPELRLEAVRALGSMGANDLLWQLYQKETAVDVKRQIINALQAAGNTTRMIELAKSEKDPDLRRAAIRNLGMMGSRTAGDTLAELYPAETDTSTKRIIVNALFTQGNATALVALARKEQDISMKKDIVQKLSNMDSQVARSYMLELLK